MWWLPTKQRFALSDDGQQIRANQGHSTTVDLGYEPAEPPEVLFHGMVARLLPSIRDKGLQRMGRHHVHLSPDETTARAVGGRRGKPIILRIDTRAMREAGHVFFVTPNGVWLTDAVPASFISGWGEEQASAGLLVPLPSVQEVHEHFPGDLRENDHRVVDVARVHRGDRA